MKKLIFTIFIITTTIISSNAQHVSIQYSKYGYEENRSNSKLNALQNFEDRLDQFSYSMMVEDVWLARKTKKVIIKTMEKEIRRTQREIDQLSEEGTYYSKKNNQKKYRTRSGSRVYSKRNGYSNNFELDLLYDQLDEQRRIKYRFETTKLRHSRRNIILNKKKHRKLVYQFRELMIDKLEKPRRNNREKRG